MEVSVLIVTYNHEKYIAQALDGVLMQDTDFDYEITVIEDCSTDATRKILRAYQAQYPTKIRLRLATSNQCSNRAFAEEFQASSSPYIAILDGDDYWTSPKKLQKQVEFLRAHPECVLCFHNAMRVYEDQRLPIPYNPTDQKAFSDLEDIWQGSFIASATPMFRKNALRKLPEWYVNLPYGDWPLYILYAQHGKIGYIDEILAVYRIHSHGVWSKQDRIQKLESLIAGYQSVNANLDFRYDDIAQLVISKWKRDLEVTRRVNELAATVLPQEATVIVISPAQQDLPQIDARRVWPFPERTTKEKRELFASGAAGSAEAEWIEIGRFYKFSLCTGTSQDRVLASVSVTRDDDAASAPNHSDETPNQNQVFITAAPNPVPMGSDPGKTVIRWSTGDGSSGTIYVSVKDQRMRYPADGPEAIAQVERLRAKGGGFLVAPRHAVTVLRYFELEKYLDDHYCVVGDDEVCRIYDLREALEKPAATAEMADQIILRQR